MHKEKILEIRNVSKEFSTIKGKILLACDNISLNVYKGQTLGLVGESGCGKSTLVKMVARIFDVNTGDILYKGIDISKLKGEALRKNRKNIQMVFQNSATVFNPKMQIMDIVTEPLINLGMISKKDKEKTARKLLEMVELPEEFIYRYPHSMSGGQRQRVGIARAISVEPEIVICDEATSALDVSVQDRIIKLLVKLQQEKNISFIFICHDIALVQAISHEVAIMYLGNVMETLPGEKIGEEAVHPYSRALISSVFSPDMDFKKEIELIDGEIPSPLDVPAGCPFQNRCKHCEDICKKEKPVLKEYTQNHMVACHMIN